MRPRKKPKLVEVTPRLPVADLPRTIAFYRDTLGFEVDVLWPDDDPAFVILNRDQVNLGFYLFGNGRSGAIGYAELYIEVNDARAEHKRLGDQLPIEWGPEVYSYGRREFAIRDPDQYLVIFTEPTDDKPSTAEP
jgi:catechol 2,3-dioxygenase-like lactoylglutathione lyase family enzyme